MVDLNSDSSAPGSGTGAVVDPGQIARFTNMMFQNATEGGFVSLRAFYDDKLARKRTEGAYKIRSVRINGSGLDAVVSAAFKMAQEAAESRRPVVVCPPIATFSTARADEG